MDNVAALAHRRQTPWGRLVRLAHSADDALWSPRVLEPAGEREEPVPRSSAGMRRGRGPWARRTIIEAAGLPGERRVTAAVGESVPATAAPISATVASRREVKNPLIHYARTGGGVRITSPGGDGNPVPPTDDDERHARPRRHGGETLSGLRALLVAAARCRRMG